ncbi:hypothetical protein [Spirosoma koreense]
MLGSNRLEEGMLNETLSTFRKNELDAVSPAQGIMLIDGWLQALQGEPNLDQLTGQLSELRTALQAAQPDGPYIRDLLVSLADQAQQVAEAPTSEGTWTGGLVSLSKILRHLGSQS